MNRPTINRPETHLVLLFEEPAARIYSPTTQHVSACKYRNGPYNHMHAMAPDVQAYMNLSLNVQARTIATSACMMTHVFLMLDEAERDIGLDSLCYLIVI